MRVAVTGADGFVGLRTCEALERRGYGARRIVRRADGPGDDRVPVSDLSDVTDWVSLLRGMDAVIHLAARAHILREAVRDPLSEFRRINVALTRRIAEGAAASGVRRFVFVSTIGVNGVQSLERTFKETDEPNPQEPYAQSKWECEQALHRIAENTGLELVVTRPPLVYGPGAKGNLLRMLRLVASGLPLPLASVKNRRSLISVDNLADALIRCVEEDKAAGQTYLLAEPHARSTPEMFAALYRGMHRPNRLFRFPVGLLRAAAAAAGLGATFMKLCSSLEIDASKSMRELRWTPSDCFESGMASAARWYLERSR